MRLHATISGPDGAPAVMLLHGLFGSGRNLGAIARGLAAQFRVIALDLRNHGDSDHAADMRYPTMAGDVAETMADLAVGVATVIGHSMGGKTAMMLALRHPTLVARLAVLDIAPIAYRHEHDDIIAAMRGLPLHPTMTRPQADAALAAAIGDPALRAFLLGNLVLGPAPHWRLGLAEIAEAMGDLVDWPALSVAPYDGPALLVRGGTSSYVTAAGCEAALRWFPRARIETIAGTGHWLHAERPAEVLSALNAFLP